MPTDARDHLGSLAEAMAGMPVGYLVLARNALDLARSDQRVRGLWVGGSVARGVADAGSDLDLLLAVSDVAFDEFAAGVADWLGAVIPTVLARGMPGLPGSLFATTPDCLRVDVVTEPVSGLAATPYRHRITLLDREDLTARLPVVDAGIGDGPDTHAMAGIVEEFYRQQAIFPAAVVARGDWLLGVVAVHNMQVLLYRLFAAANAPLPVMGVKQWSSRLTAQQRQVLERLPAPAADRGAVVSAMRAVRTAFIHEGRAACAMCGLDWPRAARRRDVALVAGAVALIAPAVQPPAEVWTRSGP